MRATLVACTQGLEVGPGGRKAERPVWTTANAVGVVVVLAVVLPEADRTDLVGAPLGQGDETAAGAPVRASAAGPSAFTNFSTAPIFPDPRGGAVGDGTRARPVSLGIGQIRPVNAADQASRDTRSGRDCPLVTLANCTLIARRRTLKGMARVRSGQAPAWPLVSDRSVRRGRQCQA